LWDDDTQSGGDRGMELRSDGKIGAGSGFGDVSGSTVSLNSWHHIVYATSTSTRNIYIDGILSSTSSGSLPDHSTRSFVSIGSGHNGYRSYFKGQIDDVQIYNYALSADQVKLVMNNNSALAFGTE